MNIRKDSGKYKILCLLKNSGEVKRSAIIHMLPDRSRVNVNASIRFLLENGLVQESRKFLDGKNSVRVLSLAETGEKYLEEHTDKEELRSQHIPLDYVTSKTRQYSILKIYSCLRTYGILMQEDPDRPSISLLSDRSIVPTDDDRAKLELKDEIGAFYDIREIRSKSTELHGDGPLNQTRCLGAIVRKKIVYLVYNMGSRMIRFNQSVEIRTRDTIARLFYESEKVTCILFGSSNISAMKLLYDDPKGTHPALQKERSRSEAIYASNISLKKLSVIFPEVYFMEPKTSRSYPALETALYKDETNEDEIRLDILESVPGVRPERVNREIVGTSQNAGTTYFFCLNSDLLTIDKLRKATHRMDTGTVIVIASTKETADICSRILGPRLSSIQDLDGEQIPFDRYNYYSEKIGHDTAPAPNAR